MAKVSAAELSTQEFISDYVNPVEAAKRLENAVRGAP
jgi:hypothetical protein